MTGDELAIAVGLVVLGMAGSAVWSGMETGVYTLNRVRLAVRAARSRAARSTLRLEREVSHFDRLLTTLLIANNVFNYLGTLGITALLAATALNDWAIIVLQAALLTPLLLVFGETLPKELFRRSDDVLVERLTPVLVGMRWLATATLVLPLVLLFARAAAARFGRSSVESLTSGRAHIARMLKEGGPAGAISDVQASMIDRALRFSRTPVGEVMVPIAAARVLHTDWGRERVLAFAERHPQSRFPVVAPGGRIVGVLRPLDLLLDPDVTPEDVLVEPARLSRQTSARAALAMLRARGCPLGIVEDRGRSSGVVTAKDLVEPLVGDLAEW